MPSLSGRLATHLPIMELFPSFLLGKGLYREQICLIVILATCMTAETGNSGNHDPILATIQHHRIASAKLSPPTNCHPEILRTNSWCRSAHIASGCLDAAGGHAAGRLAKINIRYSSLVGQGPSITELRHESDPEMDVNLVWFRENDARLHPARYRSAARWRTRRCRY